MKSLEIRGVHSLRLSILAAISFPCHFPRQVSPINFKKCVNQTIELWSIEHTFIDGVLDGALLLNPVNLPVAVCDIFV